MPHFQHTWVLSPIAHGPISLGGSLYSLVSAFSPSNCETLLRVVWKPLGDVRFAQWVVFINVSLKKATSWGNPWEASTAQGLLAAARTCWRFPGLNLLLPGIDSISVLSASLTVSSIVSLYDSVHKRNMAGTEGRIPEKMRASASPCKCYALLDPPNLACGLLMQTKGRGLRQISASLTCRYYWS